MDTGEFPKVNSSEVFDEPEIPKGHIPLVHLIERQFKTPEGEIVRSEWPLGPETFHIDLFVEYERSFGRGIAKLITHQAGFLPPISQQLRDQLPNVVDEYSKIASEIKKLSLSGSEDEVNKEIRKIRDYRAKYPDLYSDITDPNAPKHRIKWKVSTD